MAHTTILAVNLMIIKYTAEVLIIGISPGLIYRFDLQVGKNKRSDKDKIRRKKRSSPDG